MEAANLLYIFLLGSDSPAQALGTETCPVSLPSPPVAPIPKVPQPEVDLPQSPGDMMEKGRDRQLEGG